MTHFLVQYRSTTLEVCGVLADYTMKSSIENVFKSPKYRTLLGNLTFGIE